LSHPQWNAVEARKPGWHWPAISFKDFAITLPPSVPLQENARKVEWMASSERQPEGEKCLYKSHVKISQYTRSSGHGHLQKKLGETFVAHSFRILLAVCNRRNQRRLTTSW
jgi:hypothetical protein